MTRFPGLVALVLGGLALAACGEEKDPNVTTIAVAGPVTGQYASFGTQMINGADLAIADINAAGGVLGKRLELDVGDDACDPKQAVAVANKMVGAGVPLVAGHFCSGSSVAGLERLWREQHRDDLAGLHNPALTDSRAGPNIYRVVGRDDQQGGVAGAYLAEHFGDKNIAIIDDKTAYGKGLADQVKAALNAAGVQEVLTESYSAGEKDYSALVSKLKQAGVDVLYVGGYHTEAGLILRQMRDQGMDTVLMGGDALVTQEYWSITGPAGEGTLMTFSPDPRKNPAAADVVARFKEKGIEPEGYVLYTYAAIQAWAEAAKDAGTIEAPQVVKALDGNSFDTVIGELRFNDKGDPNLPPYAVYRWSDGAYEQIGDQPPAG